MPPLVRERTQPRYIVNFRPFNHRVPAATAATADTCVCCRLVGALEMKARSPVELANVCDMKLTDEDGTLFRNMMIKQRAPS